MKTWSKRKNTSQFVQKMSSFAQIDDFSWFFTKWGTFCKFWLKSWSERKNMPVFSKSWKFWPNRLFFMAFHEIWHFFQVLAENLIKTKNMPVCCKNVKFYPNWWFFMVFHEMRHFLRFSPEKFIKTEKHSSLFEKLIVLAKSNFSCFFRKWGTFCNFFLKTSSKRKNMLVCSKSVKIYPNRGFFTVFNEMRHVLQVFAENFIKTQKHATLFEKSQVLAKSMLFHAFSWFFTEWGTFCNYWPKNWSKRKRMPLFSKRCKSWPNWLFFMLFH